MLAANWYLFEIWRFVFIQKEVANLARTAMEFPPMQAGASFNLDSIKAQIKKAMDKRGSSGN
jgi:arylsulfatase